MADSVADLRATCQLVRDAAAQGTLRSDLDKRFAEFAGKYPRLYGACSDATFDLGQLEPMLQALHALRHGGLNADAANQRVFESLKAQFLS